MPLLPKTKKRQQPKCPNAACKGADKFDVVRVPTLEYEIVDIDTSKRTNPDLTRVIVCTECETIISEYIDISGIECDLDLVRDVVMRMEAKIEQLISKIDELETKLEDIELSIPSED